ncbi:ABC transporter substrate-binding protein [Natrinema gelatinilyticum]|uniref:ABC transporter substrate-binding protein n=1 Tax=Natrinema gelatinilyticum TaxID=2961571 RepID=UPI0020C4CA36|nr:MqnA/MqnD/SBP family protein [Natrinema gelatinilyticum]
MTEATLAFSTTPFYNTRQFYYALENGRVTLEYGTIRLEHNHSPQKDQLLLSGELDATTMSMGKYVTAKQVSHTDVVPTDPLAVAAGLTYQRGNGMFVRESDGISDPQDLEGMRVGIHDRSLAMTYHKAIIEDRFDCDPDAVDWVVDTHQRLADRMQAGELDAVERINDWYWGLRENPEYRLLYDMGEEWTTLTGYRPLVHLICVDSELYETDPVRVRAFVDALQRSRAYRYENRDQVLAAFLEEDDSGEWSGERSVEALRRVTDGVDCPFVLETDQRRNVRDWMEYASRYGVFETVPIADERLFPN